MKEIWNQDIIHIRHRLARRARPLQSNCARKSCVGRSGDTREACSERKGSLARTVEVCCNSLLVSVRSPTAGQSCFENVASHFDHIGATEVIWSKREQEFLALVCCREAERDRESAVSHTADLKHIGSRRHLEI